MLVIVIALIVGYYLNQQLTKGVAKNQAPMENNAPEHKEDETNQVNSSKEEQPTKDKRIKERESESKNNEYLRDMIQFTREEIRGISIHRTINGEAISEKIDDDQLLLLYQSLYWMKVNSKSPEHFPRDNLVYIRFETENGEFNYPYHYESNVIGILDEESQTNIGYHPDENVYNIMTHLLNSDSIMGHIYLLEQKADRYLASDEFQIKDTLNQDEEYWSKFLVNGINDFEWKEELKGSLIKEKIAIYEGCLERLDEIVTYENGIIQMASTLVFTTDQYVTNSGIKVGDSSSNVLKLLGEPNLKTTHRWSYQIGDYLKFHLLIEDGKVKYILKTLPC